MIRIVQVKREFGEVLLKIKFSDNGETNQVVIENSEIIRRMRELKRLVGRPLELVDLKNVVVTLINEVREGQQPLLERFRYEDYVGLDLEA